MIPCSEGQIREYTDKGWWGSETVHDLFLRNAQRTPEAVAITDPPNRAELTVGQPQRWTYAELSQASERLAGGLLEAGVRADDVVMVQLPNIVELVCLYVAAARIGAIVSPLPMQYRTHELKQVIRLAEPKAFVTTTSFDGFNPVEMVRGLQPDFPSLKIVIALGPDLPGGVLSLSTLLGAPRDEGPLRAYLAGSRITANDVYTLCWTSGTEADPKGVPRTHNHWISIAYASVDACELEPGCNLLNPFPLVNMAAIGGMLVPWLLTGGKLALHQPLSLPVFLGQIKAEQVNYTVVPPALLNMLLRNPAILANADISSLKNIGSGSAPLSPWMVSQYQEKHGIRVINLFGSNEGSSFSSGPKEIPDPAERAQFFPRFGVPEFQWSSRAAAFMSTKLVDLLTREVITEPGIPGEMAIKGPAIFAGYHKRPDLTRKAFDADGYFHTGDLFEIAPGKDGRLSRYRFVGRLTDLIIRGGVKISPEEIEGLLVEHPKVAEVAVFGYPDAILGEKICATVVPKKGQAVTLEELLEFLQTKGIATYKVPERLLVVETLPRNPVGKVLKRTMKVTAQASALPPQ